MRSAAGMLTAATATVVLFVSAGANDHGDTLTTGTAPEPVAPHRHLKAAAPTTTTTTTLTASQPVAVQSIGGHVFDQSDSYRQWSSTTTTIPTPTVDYDSTIAELQAYVRTQAEAGYGWTGAEWDALDWLINKESSWNPQAANPGSSARGLGQFLASTATNYSREWGIHIDHPVATGEWPTVTDHVDHVLRYIEERYGTPTKAQSFHRLRNWY